MDGHVLIGATIGVATANLTALLLKYGQKEDSDTVDLWTDTVAALNNDAYETLGRFDLALKSLREFAGATEDRVSYLDLHVVRDWPPRT